MKIFFHGRKNKKGEDTYMSKNSSSGGMGFLGVLQIVFIVLKLCKVITWSWLVVLIPLWIELLLCVGVLVFIYWLKKK